MIVYEELVNGKRIVIGELIYHVALYIDYTDDGITINYKDRYCFKDKKTALKSIEEFKISGIWKYWQKHHNKNIVIRKNKAYLSGDLEIEENVLFKVDWLI